MVRLTAKFESGFQLRSRRCLENGQDIAWVTINHQWEIICGLSICAWKSVTLNELEWSKQNAYTVTVIINNLFRAQLPAHVSLTLTYLL